LESDYSLRHGTKFHGAKWHVSGINFIYCAVVTKQTSKAEDSTRGFITRLREPYNSNTQSIQINRRLSEEIRLRQQHTKVNKLFTYDLLKL
jgi:hypothetical protein